LTSITRETLEEQVFWLMYSTMGSGLGQQFSEIMGMPVSWKNALYQRLMERLQEEADAVKGGG